MKNLLFLILIFCSTSNAQDYYIHAGKLFDSEKGEMISNMTVIVSDKKIKEVRKGFKTPKKDQDIVIDLKDSTVMPGFIDLHVHIESEYNPEKYMNALMKKHLNIF